MKITKRQLRKLILQEVRSALNEEKKIQTIIIGQVRGGDVTVDGKKPEKIPAPLLANQTLKIPAGVAASLMSGGVSRMFTGPKNLTNDGSINLDPSTASEKGKKALSTGTR